MKAQPKFSNPPSEDDAAKHLARTHILSGAKPSQLAIYRSLRALPDWLKTTKSYCLDPAPIDVRAADWFLDNDYQIARAIRGLKNDLPVKFYNSLPRLNSSSDNAEPRIFDLAHALIENAHPHLSLSQITEFVSSYQTVSALTNAELWALPSMLRMACIEHLMDAFEQINTALSPSFQLSQQARRQRSDDPIDRISASITNLIAVNAIKWADFVDHTSSIEARLAEDPAGIYPKMNFETRDRYRKRVEHLAKRSALDESGVAGAVLVQARAHHEDKRKGHVGYWLVDAGRFDLEETINYRRPRAESWRRFSRAHATTLYFSALCFGVLLGLIVPIMYLSSQASSIWLWLLGLLVSIIPASLLSVYTVHWLATKLVRPLQLPELDFRKAIPEEFSTAIVVPIIVGNVDEVRHVTETLEVRRLANPDPTLRFVVLSDFTDAAQQTMPEDKNIEHQLVSDIRQLNAKYDLGDGGPFILMHRARQFNESQNCWMGWERKRGKLEQFNRFVLGNESNGFSCLVGNTQSLRKVRFAIVLDADTDLPPNSAARLIGMLAHPLNRAQFDENSGKLIAGYTIIQPRVEILPQGGSGTLFSHLYSGDTAIDIYSRAVSDVYQDLFGSGVFIGKGIYDIAAVERTLAGRVPENAILSHDLFEGIHGRAALASNVVFYEDFPESYAEYARRLHRWVRGDWQLVPWLGRHVPAADGKRLRNAFSALDRWKILDNLRRSLVPPSLLLFFFAAWNVLPGSATIWTLLAIAAPGSYLIGELYAVARGGIRQDFFSDVIHRMMERGGRWFLAIVFLVSDTLISVDAIARTLWRVFVSKKNLLEWRSAAHTSSMISNGSVRALTWRMMWPSSAVSAAIALDLAVFQAEKLLPAAPILLLWLLAPEIAIWSAKTRHVRQETLRDEDKDFLRKIARRTWHFFETFAGPDDNWLPPDNYQEDPRAVVAHRTSPTNIGMFLVSALSARDLGFITMSDFLVRGRNTLDSIDRLKTYRGHVLNWYDTQSLEPLEPQYVSTVDSGNLAIALITLKQGCLDPAQRSVLTTRCWDGLQDTFDLLWSALRGYEPIGRQLSHDLADQTKDKIDRASSSPEAWRQCLTELESDHWPNVEQSISAALGDDLDVPSVVFNEIHTWLDRFNHHLRAMQRDLEYYFPWSAALSKHPSALAGLANEIAQDLRPDLSSQTVLEKIAKHQSEIASMKSTNASREDERDWLQTIADALKQGAERHRDFLNALETLADRAGKIAFGMDFTFLYDPEVRLFVIGYNVSSGRLDTSHYDLLATEARLASFFALAKHDAPIEHWYSFNRPITRLDGKPSILSWNGSMFEYLMAPLFLPSRRDTLLGESEITAVEYQRRYAKDRGVPWGISESAFGITDADGNYQYRAFGVPGLGIRRGLSEDLVIAPYASALALCTWPGASVKNLQSLEELGAVTVFGFWDALDFTPGRAIEKHTFVPVKTYMAHHQGMILAAILNVLQDDVLIDRVLSEKALQAVDLLLQERVPWEMPIEPGRQDEAWERHAAQTAATIPGPWVPSSDASIPQFHMLGNGQLSAIVSESGSGGLNWQNNAITRWRADPTRDCYGSWLYLKDHQSGEIWSAGRQPVGFEGEDHKTLFHQHMVETFRRDHEIATRIETVIAPFDDVEIRRLTLTNESRKEREIHVTSYGETVLAPARDDERHPAFSKLFVGAKYLPDEYGLLIERRPRRPEDQPPVLLHKLAADDPEIHLIGHETDRAKFIGRGGSLKAPLGVTHGLAGTTGWTLDPLMALQVRVKLRPGETKQFSFLTCVGTTRATVLELSRDYSSAVINRAFRDAALETARKVSSLELDVSRLPEMQVLSSLLLQPAPALRRVDQADKNYAFGQPDLWRFGISGDLPIILVRASDDQDSDLMDVLMRAHLLWRNNGLHSDLVIVRTGMTGYEAPMREHILSMLRDIHVEHLFGRNGGIHLLSEDQLDPLARKGLDASSHIVLEDDAGALGEMLDRVLEPPAPSPRFEATQHSQYRAILQPEAPDDLAFSNGYGGFDVQAGEYVIHLGAGELPPAPWCNVLSNDGFGSIVSESGLGFTWAINSGENRLTPWSNDPVLDTPGEVLYLRDEVSARAWTVTPAPMAEDQICQIRHGKGYTRWTQHSHELEQELLAFVPKDAPVKIVRLRLRNMSDHDRRITATYYAEWLLGAVGSAAKPHVVCNYNPDAKAIVAINNWNPEFEHRAAFLAASHEPHSTTGSRHDFLGLEGDYANPAAMARWDLGGAYTPGGDPCAAYQVHVDIPAGKVSEVIFVLGQTADLSEVRGLVTQWTKPDKVAEALEALSEFWSDNLNSVQVASPDPAFDLMINQWFPYQNLASRIMARAGFYQAGGAFGYRDQLQDMLAMLHADPDRVRRHILFAAASQFEEGDALHWWHPPTGRGVRTRCSDDYLWLVLVTARYIEATGDNGILDEEVPFLRGPELQPEEGDRYALFEQGEIAPLYDHCTRALDRMMTLGQHGLPLIGTGDWNDGMDRVGDEGRGESVWLAWFQIKLIRQFSKIAVKRGHPEAAERWRKHADRLRKAVRENAWDGHWFIRAFDDDSQPWGSAANDECQIDSLAQSWSVLSGGASKPRQKQAITSAAARLLDETNRLVLLLDPPFHESERDPGYIQAYPVGIRENGGQYTHAATWLGMAFAKLGDGDMAYRIFDTINPIRRTSNKDAADHYLREPYVLTGDVSGGERPGLGGWSWYTGAAGWAWQLGIEGIFGVTLNRASVTIDPALPTDWGEAQIVLNNARGKISIDILDPDRVGSGVAWIEVDGRKIAGKRVMFPGHGKSCHAIVRLGEKPKR